ncbi:MAG: hypothetical protein Q4D56_03155 [Bacteroides sp.]|nr:hypothetical protein [Bacteroides sp.]
MNRDTAYYRNMNEGLTDEASAYPAFHEYMDYYLMSFNLHVQQIHKPQGRNADWRKTFDEISTKGFQTKTKRLLLQRCIHEIGENFDAEDLQAYLDKNR